MDRKQDYSGLRAVVWGADNYNTLGLQRSLAVADLDIILIVTGSKQGVASASKYCKKYYIAHSIEKSVEYMIENYPEQREANKKAFLFPGGDGASLGIANNYDVLHNRFFLMCSTDPQILINVTDKNVMGKFAQEAGLLTPAAQPYKSGDTNINVPFPALLKPVHVEGRTEFQTKLIQSKEDLFSFSHILNHKNTYILQQYINKSCDIVVYGCRLPDGTLKLAGHHTLERWSSDGGGSYGHLYPDIPEYLNPKGLAKLFDLIDYHGLFSAEYGFMDGKAYFYEVNLRNDGFCHLSFQAGANLPLLWVQACLNLPLTASSKIKESVVGINEIYDIINVWRGNISCKKYKSDKAEAKAFHFYDPNDLQPYKNMHRRMFWEIPFRAVLKKYRPFIVRILKVFGL